MAMHDDPELMQQLARHFAVVNKLGNIGDILADMEEYIRDAKEFGEAHKEDATSPSNFCLMNELLDLALKWISIHKQIIVAADLLMKSNVPVEGETIQ